MSVRDSVCPLPEALFGSLAREINFRANHELARLVTNESIPFLPHGVYAAGKQEGPRGSNAL
jgi:hypothetical protein